MSERKQKLFHVQDSDCSAYVIADDWTDALTKWREWLVDSDYCEPAEAVDADPRGIALVADERNLIIPTIAQATPTPARTP